MIDKRMEESLINLKVIARLKNGDKLVIRGAHLAIDTHYPYVQMVTRYVLGDDRNTTVEFISNVIEKPNIKEAPSNNAVIGRYILNKKIFKFLKTQKRGKGGEIHITDSIKAMIENKFQFIGHKFSGKYLDCGSMKGYIKSTLEISKL